ncbi:MAG TPA: alpha/beta hydrolase [Micromonosporaceae bacterium]|nr:alpha/beta hydrolase [Micromonosporaceae bacterium]
MRDFRWPPPPGAGPNTYGPGPTGPHSGRPLLPQPETAMLGTPHGVELEYLVTGAGEPVTVFAHGLGNGIAETRPLGSAVNGRRVFFQFRGHGRSSAPEGRWTYADLARDLRAVADLTGATRALGVSLGAGALCRALADDPRRFERVVFYVPSALDKPREQPAGDRLTSLLAAIETGDAGEVASAVALEVPANLRNTPPGWAYLRQRVEQLMNDGLAPGLASLPEEIPVEDRMALADVTAEALVIGCRDDDVHPASVAEELAEVLPKSTLYIYDRPGVLWTQRSDLRDRIAGFLNAA